MNHRLEYFNDNFSYRSNINDKSNSIVKSLRNLNPGTRVVLQYNAQPPASGIFQGFQNGTVILSNFNDFPGIVVRIKSNKINAISVGTSAGTIPPGNGNGPTGSNNNDPIVLLDISDDNTGLESTAINLINQERQRQGLRSLQADTTLNRLAAIKAQDVAQNQSCEHFSPTLNGDEGVLLEREGIRPMRAVGNLAYESNTAEGTVNAWLNSPIHRANILDPDITRIGMGYSSQNNYNSWSMIATSDFQVTPPRNGWVQQNGTWYYYVNSVAQTGWVQISEVWWQFDNTGAWTQQTYQAPYYYRYDGTNWSNPYYYDSQNNQWWFWNGTSWIKV